MQSVVTMVVTMVWLLLFDWCFADSIWLGLCEYLIEYSSTRIQTDAGCNELNVNGK